MNKCLLKVLSCLESLSLYGTWPRCSEALLGACPQLFLGPHLHSPSIHQVRSLRILFFSLFANTLFLFLVISSGTMTAAFPGIFLPLWAL